MMPYYFPTDYTYAPQIPQYPQMPAPQPQINQSKTIIDRVQGEAAANIYPVQAGQEVILLDIDNPYIYRKERGLDNKLTQKRFRLVEDEIVEDNKPKVDLAEYVKIDDVALMISEAVDRKMSEYTLKPTKKKVVVEEE